MHSQLISSQLVLNLTFALSRVSMGHLLNLCYNGQSGHIAGNICTTFWVFSTFICNWQDLKRIYVINTSAQKRPIKCRLRYAYRHENQCIFTMVFINLKQDLKKSVPPKTCILADLFTLAPAPPPPTPQQTTHRGPIQCP